MWTIICGHRFGARGSNQNHRSTIADHGIFFLDFKQEASNWILLFATNKHQEETAE
jgi:hypothetical protein